MRNTDLFQLALGLVPPWLVNDVRFDVNKKRLDIEIDFARGGRFPCPHCNAADCPVHDTTMQKWRHLDFFQHSVGKPDVIRRSCTRARRASSAQPAA